MKVKKSKSVKIKLSKKEIQSFLTAYNILSEVLELTENSSLFREKTINIYNKSNGVYCDNEDFAIAWDGLSSMISLFDECDDKDYVTFNLEDEK